MIIIVNNEAQDASAWRALEVINTLRGYEHTTVRPDIADGPWIRTIPANPEYL